MIIMIITMLLSIGCGDNKVINGKEYKTYGLFNKEEAAPNIEYRLITGNIVWACLLSGTLVMPIYFLGLSLYEPVGPKNN